MLKFLCKAQAYSFVHFCSVIEIHYNTSKYWSDWFFHTALEATSKARCRTYIPPGSPGGLRRHQEWNKVPLGRAPAPPALPTSSTHVPLRTQAEETLVLKQGLPKRNGGSFWRRSAFSAGHDTQPVNATSVALTRRAAHAGRLSTIKNQKTKKTKKKSGTGVPPSPVPATSSSPIPLG